MAQQKSQDELWKQKLLETARAEEEARELVERAYQSADVLSAVLLEPSVTGEPSLLLIVRTRSPCLEADRAHGVAARSIGFNRGRCGGSGRGSVR